VTARTSSSRSALGLVVLGASWALMLVVVALAVVTVALPKASSAVPLTVLTGSMRPALPPGSLVIVRPVDAANLAIGDIATYQIRSGEPDVVTHRIIGIHAGSGGGQTFDFKGDNNPVADAARVQAEQIQGRVWYSVPLVGHLSTAVNGPHGTLFSVAVAAGLLVYGAWLIISSVWQAIVRRQRATIQTKQRTRSAS